MRAILIDPDKRTFVEMQVGYDEGDYETVLSCECFTTGAFLNGCDVVYVSDDDMDDRDNPRFWFQVDADRSPPSSFPIGGLGLVVGIAGDRAADAKISIDEMAKRITFTERKFRASSHARPNKE